MDEQKQQEQTSGDTYVRNFCRNVSRLRRKNGWTMTELGEKTGYTKAAISRIEKGTNVKDIPLGRVMKFAEVFQVSVDELVQGFPMAAGPEEQFYLRKLLQLKEEEKRQLYGYIDALSERKH